MGTKKRWSIVKDPQAIIDHIEWYTKSGYIECDDEVPSTAGLARSMNTSKTPIQKWCKGDTEMERYIASMIEELDNEQERICIAKGLTGEYVSPIVKILLHRHGYSDKVQQDNVSSDGSMSSKDMGDAVLKALQSKHNTDTPDNADDA